jgi:hypothetical protein
VFQTHKSELDSLVEERERWLICYQQAANVRSVNVWNRRLFFNACHQDVSKREIQTIYTKFKVLREMLAKLY